jgi:hypothetical protein
MRDRRDDESSSAGAWKRTDEKQNTGGRDGAHEGRQKAAAPHAEGQHGEKTHARFIEQLHSREPEETPEERLERERQHAANYGKRRLVEDREQHDEAEKNSEHTRLAIEHERGQADGPSDNTGNLHGPLGHREQRADNKPNRDT